MNIHPMPWCNCEIINNGHIRPCPASWLHAGFVSHTLQLKKTKDPHVSKIGTIGGFDTDPSF